MVTRKGANEQNKHDMQLEPVLRLELTHVTPFFM